MHHEEGTNKFHFFDLELLCRHANSFLWDRKLFLDEVFLSKRLLSLCQQFWQSTFACNFHMSCVRLCRSALGGCADRLVRSVCNHRNLFYLYPDSSSQLWIQESRINLTTRIRVQVSKCVFDLYWGGSVISRFHHIATSSVMLPERSSQPAHRRLAASAQ